MAFGILEGISALGALGGLFGSAGAGRQASGYEDAQAELARLMGGQYGQYGPKLNELLWQIGQAPEQDPWWQTQMRQVQGDVMGPGGYYAQALPQALMRLGGGSGGQNLANSLFAQNAAMGIMAAGGREMAQQRGAQVGQMHQRRMGALGMLGAGLRPEAAAGIYGGLAQGARGREAGMAAGVGDLLGLLAMSGYRPAGPPTAGAGGAGFGAGPIAGATSFRPMTSGYGGSLLGAPSGNPYFVSTRY